MLLSACSAAARHHRRVRRGQLTLRSGAIAVLSAAMVHAQAAPAVAEVQGAPAIVKPSTSTAPGKAGKRHQGSGLEPTNAAADPGDPFGDDHGGLELGAITLRSLVQTRYTGTFAAPSANPKPGYALREDYLVRQGDGLALNRFFVRLSGADPSGLAGVKGILDFAELRNGGGSSVVKQAYATLHPLGKRLRFAAGVLKLPFSTLELDPIAKYELADVGQADALVKDLGFAGRDVGVEAMVAPLADPAQMRITLGAYRGHAHDEHAELLGAWGARLETRPVKALRLGFDFVDQPRTVAYQNPFDTSKKDVLPSPPDPFFPTQKDWSSGTAWSADVTLEVAHFSLRTEAMLGRRVDSDSAYGARGFAAVWGLLSYRFRVGPVHLVPAVRAEWLDGDREHARGRHRLVSFGVSTVFSKYARLLLDVSRNDVQPGSPILDQPRPLQAQPFMDLANTRLVAQLQVEL